MIVRNSVDNIYEHVDGDDGDVFSMAATITTTTIISNDTFSKYNVSFAHTSVIYIGLVRRFPVQTVTYFSLFFSVVYSRCRQRDTLPVTINGYTHLVARATKIEDKKKQLILSVVQE